MIEACRVYLSPNDDSIFCVVSPEDYQWAIQWKWQFTWDRHKNKMYATRSTWENGRRKKLYLHKQILSERMQAIQPSPKHHIGDHADSDSLNNRRGNLEYVTPVQNAERKRSKRWRHLPEPAKRQPRTIERQPHKLSDSGNRRRGERRYSSSIT